MSEKTGGPAFPVLPPCTPDGSVPSGYPFPEEGMTLLDHFAGQAMSSYPSSYPEGVHENVAEWCYDRAEAMIAEREKRK